MLLASDSHAVILAAASHAVTHAAVSLASVSHAAVSLAAVLPAAVSPATDDWWRMMLSGKAAWRKSITTSSPTSNASGEMLGPITACKSSGRQPKSAHNRRNTHLSTTPELA